MRFNPCKGGNACSREGSHCDGCGRSMEEIEGAKRLVGDLVRFAKAMGYENSDEFFRYVAIKAAGKMTQG